MEEGGSSEHKEQIIPGPAGNVQVALRRKKSKDPASFNEIGEQMPTQEFLQKVYEAPPGADTTFLSEPWVCAMEYVKENGYLKEDGTCLGSSVAEIQRGRKWVKIPMVVGIITVVNPNGLGDAMISLKDPTGTIAASVNNKVYTQSMFGANIRVGNVLVLQNVVVGSFILQSECCLNIVPKNVLKVIPKETTMYDIVNCEVAEDSDVE